MMQQHVKHEADTDAYLLAASVLDSFDPALIAPFRFKETQSSDYDALLAKAVLTQLGPTAFEWRMSDDVRKAGLRILASQGLLREALSVNPGRTKSIYQAVFEQYIVGGAPPLNLQSIEQLQASLQAVRLLAGVLPNLPEERDIAALVRKQTFLQQFRLLADAHFFGRTDELRKLEEFVDARPVSGLRHMRRSVYEFVSRNLGMDSFVKAPPLLIKGPGGIGKSSLLAKFLIQHADSGAKDGLVFAYIDFDRAGIWPDEPLTVLAELAGQFANQAGQYCEHLLQLQTDINEALSRSADYSVEYDSSESLGSASVAQQRQKHYLSRFADLSERAFVRGRRTTMLLVFDSFEEVTQRGESHVITLFGFLNEIQLAMPRLRSVLSGRGALRLQVDHIPLELRPIKGNTTMEILRSYDIADPDILECIVERVSGHPLSIRLAAQLVVMSERDATLDPSLATWKERFFSKLDERLDEGIIFRRIIAHIDDPELRKLVSPGFVLRLITPELILYVLKEPCGLKVDSIVDARNLFLRLAQYNSLVSQRSSWRLKHRADVRGMILEGLLRTDPDLCRQIWQRGAVHFSHQLDVSNRAEEMYCRLMLSDSPDEMNQSWMPGMENLLSSSQDELPAESAEFLQYKLLTGDRSVHELPKFSSAAHVLREAEEMKFLLSRGDADGALKVPKRLPQPGENPLDPLYVLTARAYAQLRQFDRAFEMAYQALELVSGRAQTDTNNNLDLLLLAMQISLEWRGPGRRSAGGSTFSPDKVWHWFQEIPRGPLTRYRRLRVAMYMIELIRLESEGDVHLGGRTGLEADCVVYALGLLDKTNSFHREINGLFMLKTYGLLAAEQPGRFALRTLLMLYQVRNTLAGGFAQALNKRLKDVMGRRKVHSSRADQLLAYLGKDVSGASRRAVLEGSEFSNLDFQVLADAVALEFAERDRSRRGPLQF